MFPINFKINSVCQSMPHVGGTCLNPGARRPRTGAGRFCPQSPRSIARSTGPKRSASASASGFMLWDYTVCDCNTSKSSANVKAIVNHNRIKSRQLSHLVHPESLLCRRTVILAVIQMLLRRVGIHRLAPAGAEAFLRLRRQHPSFGSAK